MHMFSRRVVMSGLPADYLAYATDMRSFVSQKTGTEVSLWAMGFGAPAGTMVFSARVEGVAGVQAIQAKLADDAEYAAKLAAGAAMIAAPSEDSLAQPIHGEVSEAPPVGSVATVTSATIANGAYAAAIGWGVEMAQLAEKVTSMPTMFLMNSFGTFGQVTWISIAPDAASADTAGDTMNSDPDYMARLADVGDLFIPGSGHRALAIRIA